MITYLYLFNFGGICNVTNITTTHVFESPKHSTTGTSVDATRCDIVIVHVKILLLLTLHALTMFFLFHLLIIQTHAQMLDNALQYLHAIDSTLSSTSHLPHQQALRLNDTTPLHFKTQNC